MTAPAVARGVPTRTSGVASAPLPWADRFLLAVAIGMMSFGVTFPIYGTPPVLGLARITFFRASILVLLFLAPIWLRHITSVLSDFRVLALVLVAGLRAVSLVWSSGRASGAEQVEWFAESVLGLSLLVACAKAYPGLPRTLFWNLLGFGLLSGVAVCVQFAEYQATGAVSALPLAMSPFGVQLERTTTLVGTFYPLGAGGRILGPFQEPNATGSVMSYVGCLAIALLLDKRWKLKALSVTLLSVLACGLWASGSRQAIVAIGFTALFFAFLNSRRSTWAALIVLMLLAGAGSYVAIEGIAFLRGNLDPRSAGTLARVVQATESGDVSGGRFQNYRLLAGQLNADAFLLGRGDGFAFAADAIGAHNGYLVVLLDDGMWALGLLMAALIATFWGAFRAGRHPTEQGTDRRLSQAGLLVVVVWILLVGMNWAQLNQAFAWPFLALAFMSCARPRTVARG